MKKLFGGQIYGFERENPRTTTFAEQFNAKLPATPNHKKGESLCKQQNPKSKTNLFN
ncbi:MAG: hypothetical protein PHV05_02045 [Candidatus Riflebacteria bacterium]|nr:hypothetical protein [Candidatus Riflebacteria bacterium]